MEPIKLELLEVDYNPDGTYSIHYPDGDIAAIVYGNLALDVDAKDLAYEIARSVRIKPQTEDEQ